MSEDIICTWCGENLGAPESALDGIAGARTVCGKCFGVGMFNGETWEKVEPPDYDALDVYMVAMARTHKFRKIAECN